MLQPFNSQYKDFHKKSDVKRDKFSNYCRIKRRGYAN